MGFCKWEVLKDRSMMNEGRGIEGDAVGVI